MALQSKTVTYTPFNKTSWGFASGDLSGTHSGLTNVKVVITPQTSTHWDATGHISTAGSGSAVASYNKQQFEWVCEGPLADVDAVLDALDFFPADYSAIRNWTTTATKTNATNGTYANENPADTDAIPDTDFDLKVYDLSDDSLDGTYAIKFDPTQPTFGKQRPYWSTEPTNEDANTAAHNAVAGGLLNLGIIAQGSDTDPLTVTCEFRNYNTTTMYTGSAYGVFTAETGMFIGDKKPANRDSATNRINFTGTKAEVIKNSTDSEKAESLMKAIDEVVERSAETLSTVLEEMNQFEGLRDVIDSIKKQIQANIGQFFNRITAIQQLISVYKTIYQSCSVIKNLFVYCRS